MKHLARYIVGIVLAIALLGTTMAVAFAGENDIAQPGPDRPGPGPRLGGEVTAIDGGTITLLTPTDETLVVSTTAETTVRILERQSEGTLSDLAVGDQVRVHGRPTDDGTVVAKAIIIEPEGERAGGRVTAVDGTSITVEDRDGTPTTILTSDSTSFRQGKDAVTLADITEEMGITAFGSSPDDGSLDATLVLIHPPRTEGPDGEQQPGERGPRPEGPNDEQRPAPEQDNTDEPTSAPTTPDTNEKTDTDAASDVYANETDETARDNTILFSNNQQSGTTVYLPLMHG